MQSTTKMGPARDVQRSKNRSKPWKQPKTARVRRRRTCIGTDSISSCLLFRSVLPSHLGPSSFVLHVLAARRLGSGYNAQRGCSRDKYMLKMSSLEC